MADGPGFAETIVDMLGTPGDPWGELLGFAIVAGAAAAWVAVEQGLAYFAARRLRPPRPRGRDET